MSFFGGGTDYPVWYREHGGSVLGVTINKYCYISCRYLPPFFKHKSRIVYSKVETVSSNNDIEHPAVRGTLQHLKMTSGVEIHHDGDLPARTGLGSSSSFTVGFLNCLFALKHQMATKTQLAKEAVHVEQSVLKENVGSQDQIMAAFGGFNRIDFHRDDSFTVTPMILNQEKLVHLQKHILLYFTGFSRFASDIAGEQIQKTKERTTELTQIHEMVDEAVSILAGKCNFTEFGKLLHEGWKLKRGLTSKISSPAIDEIYEAALSGGAIGGKLLGAGGGGFMLIFAKPEDHLKIEAKLNGLLRVPVRFENEGSQIIVYQPNNISDSVENFADKSPTVVEASYG